MCNKFTKDEWMLFASQECQEHLRIRMLMHAADCQECRSFIRNISRLKAALADAKAACASTPLTDESEAFVRVASDGRGSNPAAENGILTVTVICNDGHFTFRRETLSRTGCAGKYALNQENSGAVLRDAEDALVLRLSGNKLTVRLADAEPSAHVSLTDSDESSVVCLPGKEYSLELPDRASLELMIRFEG